MDNTTLLSSLNLITLVVVLAVLIISFAWFLRSRRNREATKRALSNGGPKMS